MISIVYHKIKEFILSSWEKDRVWTAIWGGWIFTVLLKIIIFWQFDVLNFIGLISLSPFIFYGILPKYNWIKVIVMLSGTIYVFLNLFYKVL